MKNIAVFVIILGSIITVIPIILIILEAFLCEEFKKSILSNLIESLDNNW